MKRDLTEGGIRVPTIAWWPGKIKANTTNDHQWYFGDFMKTFAELAETPAPEDIDSDSFVSTLTGHPPEKNGPAIAAYTGSFMRGVRPKR